MDDFPRVLPCGDSGVTIEFGDRIDAAINDRVLALDTAIAASGLDGLIETVPTYRALMIHYDPLLTTYDALATRVLAMARTAEPSARAGCLVELPVCYEGTLAIDLADVALALGLAPAEVVERHCAPEYRVYMLGFQPGFAYLGGLDPALSLPRRPTPRIGAPAGTISIAAGQCAIHSVEGPSGWHWIGRTPVATMTDPNPSAPGFALHPGDRVRFFPVNERQWHAMRRAALAGEPVLEVGADARD